MIKKRTICSLCGNEKTTRYCNFCQKETLNNTSIELFDQIRLRGIFQIKFRPKGGKIGSMVKSGWKNSGDPAIKDGIYEDRIINRITNEYHQIIRDAKTGKVLHEEHEPLTQHRHINGDQPYQDLKRITDMVYAELARTVKLIAYGNNIKAIFLKYGISLRQKDGKLTQINISVPVSKKSAIVVGLRYIKKDGTKTEDLFLFEKGKKIVTGYKGLLEKLLPEYKNTHKLQR